LSLDQTLSLHSLDEAAIFIFRGGWKSVDKTLPPLWELLFSGRAVQIELVVVGEYQAKSYHIDCEFGKPSLLEQVN